MMKKVLLAIAFVFLVNINNVHALSDKPHSRVKKHRHIAKRKFHLRHYHYNTVAAGNQSGVLVDVVIRITFNLALPILISELTHTPVKFSNTH